MNERFLELPESKQRNLINAGYRAFSASPYAKASMAAVAQEAGLSKALLFYYFRNKKEYYLFLFERAMRILHDTQPAPSQEMPTELFTLVELAVRYRLTLVRDYPYLMRFAMRAYYERDPALQPELEQQKSSLTFTGLETLMPMIDRTCLRNPADAEILTQMILTLAEGCTRGREDLTAKGIQESLIPFRAMLRSLKTHYYKPEACKEEPDYATDTNPLGTL